MNRKRLRAVPHRSASGPCAFARGALLLCSGAGDAVNHELSGPIAPPPNIVGSVKEAQLSPDGTQVAYLAFQDSYQVAELYGMPPDGSSAPIKLSGTLPPGRTIVKFQFTPDGRHIVYEADQETAGFFELFGTPTDGSSPPVKLNGPLASHLSLDSGFEISPDSRHIVFTADEVLFSSPVTGAEPPTALAGPREAGGFIGEFEISPDSQRVVFSADLSNRGLLELYSAFLVQVEDGRARRAPRPQPVRLDFPRSVEADVTFFRVAGQRVVYQAAQAHPGVEELFSVPLDGGAAPIPISGTFVPGGEITSLFRLAPDGATALYVADQITNEVFELFSVPVDGSAAPVKLNAPLVAGGDVRTRGLSVSPNSRRVVYEADQEVDGLFEIFSAELGVAQSSVKISTPLRDGQLLESFLIDPRSRRVVYLVQRECHERYELWSTPIDGSPLAPAVKLNGHSISTSTCADEDEENDHFQFEISPDGGRVVYLTDEKIEETFELFSVPIDARQPPSGFARRAPRAVKLNPRLPPSGDVGFDDEEHLFAIAPDGTVVYLADQETNDRLELFRVPMHGLVPARKLNPRLALGPNPGDVKAFQVSPDGAYAAYTADAERDEVVELYGVPVRPGAQAAKLSAPFAAWGRVDGDGMRLTPDGRRVVFVAEDSDSPRELFTVPTDGGSAPVRLHGPPAGLVASFELDPGGGRVLYYASQDQANVNEVFIVPVDGGAAPLKLNGPLVPGGDVTSCHSDVRPHSHFTPDGSRVVYRADQDEDEVIELYSVRADGSSAPVRISGPMVAGGDAVFGGYCFLVSSDGSRVVYVADQAVDGRVELWSAPVDGSGAPIRLHDPLAPGREVRSSSVVLTPDGLRAVFVSDHQVEEVFELYSARLDGSSGAVKLSPPPAFRGNVHPSVWVQGSRVLFGGDVERNGRFDLFGVPADGSGPALKLNGAMAPNSDVLDNGYAQSPDGHWAVYMADARVDQQFELFAAPMDGGSAPIPLGAPVHPDGDGMRFEIGPESRHVFYVTRRDTGSYDLFRVPIRGGAAPVQLSGPMAGVGLGGQASFRVIAGGRLALYIAVQDDPVVAELYAASVVPTSAQR